MISNQASRRSIAGICLFAVLWEGKADPSVARPAPDEVRRAVDRLGDDDLTAREEALARLKGWIASDPGAMVPFLPERHADPDAERILRALHVEIELGLARKKALALAGKDPELRNAIETLFRDRQAWNLKALILLGAQAEPRRDFSLVAAAFLGHDDPAVRAVAVSELGGTKDPAVIPRLGRLLREDPDPAVQAHAALALEKSGDRSAVPDLVRLLESPHTGVRQGGCVALGLLKDPSSIPAIAPLLKNESPEIRAAAALILGQIQDRSAVPEILPLLDDADNGVRRSAVSALRLIGDPSVAPRMLKLFHDPDHTLRDMAARALGEFKDRSMIPRMGELIEQPFPFDPLDSPHAFAALALGLLVEESWRYDVAKARAWWDAHKDDPAFRR